MKRIITAAMVLSSALAFNNAMSDAHSKVPDIEGKAVMSSGTKIGDVDRVATTGTQTVVIIGLSDGTKEVAIPLSSVTVGADGTVSTKLTKAQLETYEDVDPLDFKEVSSSNKSGVGNAVADAKAKVGMNTTANTTPDLEGKEVKDSAGIEIGEVDRVAMEGTKTVVIIGLEDSQKEVAVPLSSVKIAADGSVTTSLSKATLETYEDIDPMDFKEVTSSTKSGVKNTGADVKEKVGMNTSTKTTNTATSTANTPANTTPDIEGKKVMDSAGIEVGEVDRVAMEGNKTVVIIGLEDSQKEVAVPLSSVKVAANGSVTTSLSKATLETYKDIDPLDFKKVTSSTKEVTSNAKTSVGNAVTDVKGKVGMNTTANTSPDIEGKKVMDSAGKEIGEVDRVAMDGTKTVVIIGLKDSQKEVAVPLSSVKVAANGSVSTSLPKATLETYKDIDPLDFKEVDRN